MKLFPAISIKNGHCVRVNQNGLPDIGIYSHTPVSVAMDFQSRGASYIHLVDLDGALAGRGVNESIIGQVIESVNIPVQVGGGIRTIKDIENMLNLGAQRVIMGTAAAINPALIKDVVNTFGSDKIVIAIDGKDGMVTMEGRDKVSSYYAVPFAVEMKNMGINTLIYTDIIRDGQMSGSHLNSIKEMKEATDLEIIVSGGILTLKDIEIVDSLKVYGVIVDNGIYDNSLDLKKVIELFEKGE